MKNILIIQLIILLSDICINKCHITIIGPNELSSQFNNNQIEMTYDKIGKSTYDFYIRGELFLDPDTSKIEACHDLTPATQHSQNLYQDDFRILVTKRGSCSFVQKARNGQKAGYSMIIIVNNLDTKIKNVIMADDGSGNDIYIPIVMISLDDGTKLINYMENNKGKNKNIIAEINFLNKKEEYERINVKFFFSSSELRAYELFNSLAQYIDKFGSQVNFTPIYVVHRAPFYDEENPIRTINCVSKGKYCYFPKDTTITKDGQAIIMEDLRQKCLYITSSNINPFFNYAKKFHSECLDKTITKFDEKCAKNVLTSLGLPIAVIDKCMARSFRVKDLSSNSYIDNDNIILKDEYNELLKYKLTTFPSVIINNKPLDGIIKESKIIKEICNLVKIKPEFCSFSDITGTNKRKKLLVGILIVLLIGINFIIFFIFRKYILERINERISQGGFDLDSRIKNIVSNYFSINQINNDYVKMKNNPSSLTELQNQRGKVVDIAVEMT